MRFKLLLFTLLCSLAALLPAKAETLTVYENETATNQNVPIYGYYCDSFLKCEFVIPANELADMANGTITGLTWYLQTPADKSWGNANFQVFIKEVDFTSFSSNAFTGITGATTVYQGSLDGTQSTINISFSTPYAYGGGNLLVGVYNTVKGSYSGSNYGYFYGKTESNSSVSGYSYSSLDNITSGTQQNFIPRTSFEYTFAPVYMPPTNLQVSSIGSNEATATWTPGGSETSWNVEYKKSSDASWTSAGPVSTPTIVLDVLANGTNYDVRVQSDYGSGNLSNWASTSFTTLACDPDDMGEITYVLTDTYGDGWNGNKLQIVNHATGEIIETLTIETGGKDEPITGTVSLCYNVDYDLVWVASNFGYECGFQVLNPESEVIYEFQGTGSSSGGSPTAGILTTFQIHPETCPRPTDLAVSDITAHTANASWNGDANAQSFNLRYRPKALIWDFEDEGQFNEWTLVDADNDGFNWQYFNNTGVTQGRMTAHDGEGLIASASFDNDNSSILYPNNWLISPEILLGGEFSFWAVGQDADYPAEVFGVYVCTNNSTNPSDFVQVGTDNITTSTYELYEFDLSAYAGQTGRIAIVHHNISDQFWLNVDDITYVPTEDWVTVENVTSPYIITGLDPETDYEVQVQAVYADGNSGWTNSVIFTTLEAPAEMTLAELCTSGVDGTVYRISNTNGLLGVYKQGTSIWFKDENGMAVDIQTPGANDKDYTIVDENNNTTSQMDFDQSNWIEVVFPEAVTYTDAYVKNLTGTFSKENGNPKLVLTQAVKENDVIELTNPSDAYTPNPYMAANFVGSQQGYFFSTPKAQEYAKIIWAVWDGTKMNQTSNSYGFTGSFTIDPALNSKDFSTLQIGKAYDFHAIIRKMSGSKAAGDVYKVYPTDLDGDVTTSINIVGRNAIHGEVVGVEYVNSLGMTSKTPFQGVNIVVTRYSDGSKTTIKKVFK